jgi:hypothetical protein
MLQIQVTGTIDQPQVKATSMNTFTTTFKKITEPRPQKPKPRKGASLEQAKTN